MSSGYISRELRSSEQSGSGSGSGASGSGGSGSTGDRARGGSEGASGGGGMSGQGTEIIGQAQDQAMKLVDTARQQATSQIGMQQQRVAGTLNTVATALHDASREMRKQDETAIAEYVDTVASQVEHFATMLREQDLEQLMSTTAQFARRQPALFLGAAFALGFAATRFLKSSPPSVVVSEEAVERTEHATDTVTKEEVFVDSPQSELAVDIESSQAQAQIAAAYQDLLHEVDPSLSSDPELVARLAQLFTDFTNTWAGNYQTNPQKVEAAAARLRSSIAEAIGQQEAPARSSVTGAERGVVERPVTADSGTFEETVIEVPLRSETVDVEKQAPGAEEVASRKTVKRIYSTEPGYTQSVEQTIDVNLPVRTVYNQWTQFEEFPRFMEGVEEVRQLDDTRLHWRVSIAGKAEEWDAVITDQIPDQLVAWRSTSGTEKYGRIHFTPVGADRTRITAVIGYDPEGVVEQVGDKIGAEDRRLQGDLERFKELIESRWSETGAWSSADLHMDRENLSGQSDPFDPV